MTTIPEFLDQFRVNYQKATGPGKERVFFDLCDVLKLNPEIPMPLWAIEVAQQLAIDSRTDGEWYEERRREVQSIAYHRFKVAINVEGHVRGAKEEAYRNVGKWLEELETKGVKLGRETDGKNYIRMAKRMVADQEAENKETIPHWHDLL